MNSKWLSNVKGFCGIVIMLFSSLFLIACGLDLWIGTEIFPKATMEGLMEASHILLGLFMLGWLMVLSYRIDKLQ